jgi:copper chaperone
MHMHKLHIPDMSCDHCVLRIREALESEGVKIAQIDLKTKEVTLETLQIDPILEILEDIGYPAILL